MQKEATPFSIEMVRTATVLSDIVVAHPTSIAMIRTWSYVLIMDVTYKTNKVCTSQVLHFGVETMNRAESEHSVLKLWLSTCYEEDVVIFWRKLEIRSDILEEHHRDMKSEIRDLTSLLQEISTGPISNVWEVRRLIKGVIHLVLPDDPCQPLSTPQRPQRIGKSSGLGSRFGSRSGSNPSPRGRVPFPFKNAFPGLCINLYKTGRMWLEMVTVVLGLYENHWVEIRRRMSYGLRHRMYIYEQLFGSVEHVTKLIMKTNWEEGSTLPEYWMNIPDHLYVIANTFNLCVVFLARSKSTTVLPLVSNMDGPAGTIFIGLIEEWQHFIQVQWEYH
ncbi:hypothetical protein M9H77_33843 [Catharanthus roseus]|uniref:Uncharacterized protein n=1 Tax=Catharanthus roseus TaxID=4058 RepID=A0ACB9ZJW0_CATRO|nr:hypothetical protein M9H77_33843 [Catharanthus roseus]